MTTNEKPKPEILVDTDGTRGAPASTFAKGAKNGDESRQRSSPARRY
jgi:hypothetical protein